MAFRRLHFFFCSAGLLLFPLVAPCAAQSADPPFAVGADPRIDPSKFRITTFASGLDNPLSMQSLADGSLLVTTSPGQLVRFVDLNKDGLADGPEEVLFSGLPSRPTSVRLFGDLALVNSSRGEINVLRQGATPADPFTDIGTINFDYTANHPGPRWHTSHTPGNPSPTGPA